MAAKRPVSADTIPPSQTPQRAIELIKRQLDQIDSLSKLNRGDSAIGKWKATTEAILEASFGTPCEMKQKFLSAGPGSMSLNQSDAYYQGQYFKRMADRKAVLESCIEQLEILAPPIAQVAPGQYVFHPQIERVSGHLFRDGHYKSAAFEAYIRVIEEVKQRSGLPQDGEPLMNRAFGSENQVPVIKFNKLENAEQRDEQKAFMNLFKAIVGFRNSKAHSNRLFTDPLRAHDYLALASLAMRALEQLVEA